MTDKTAEEILSNIEELLETYNPIPEPTDSVKGTPEPTVSTYEKTVIDTVMKEVSTYELPVEIPRIAMYKKFSLGEFLFKTSDIQKISFELGEDENRTSGNENICIRVLSHYTKMVNEKWQGIGGWNSDYLGGKFPIITSYPPKYLDSERLLIRVCVSHNSQSGDFKGILTMKLYKK